MAALLAASICLSAAVARAASTTMPARAPAKNIEIDFAHEIEVEHFSKPEPVPLSARWVAGDDAHAVSGPELTAWASFGVVRDFHRQGQSDVFEGFWVPPDPPVPGELVIVVSTLARGRPVFSAQSVSVSAEIDLPGVSEPGATVEILLPGAKFGPIKAGVDGRFKMPVMVPPHVEKATVQSRDKLGNVLRKTVNLYVPKVAELGLVCPRARVVAGGEALPLALASDPAQAGEVRYAASLGTLRSEGGAPLPRFVAPTRLGAGLDAAVAKISAASDKRGTARCDVEVWPGPAIALEAAFDPPFIVADGRSQSALRVVLRDAFGNGTSDGEVRLAVDGAPPARLAVKDGVFQGTLASVRGREQRQLRFFVRRVARKCPGGDAAKKVDFRQISCASDGPADFEKSLVVEHIPTGVSLRRESLGGGALVLSVSPPSEARAGAIVATDSRGAALPLKPAATRGQVVVSLPPDPGEFVVVSHPQSGMSLTVRVTPPASASMPAGDAR